MGNAKPSRYVIGPISITVHLNRTLGKFAIIIGDEHVKEENCSSIDTKKGTVVSVSKFIEELITNSSYIADIFLEVHYINAELEQKKHEFLETLTEENYEQNFYILSSIFQDDITRDDPNTSSYIHDVYRHFKECFSVVKNCPYNARFHYIDTRVPLSLIGVNRGAVVVLEFMGLFTRLLKQDALPSLANARGKKLGRIRILCEHTLFLWRKAKNYTLDRKWLDEVLDILKISKQFQAVDVEVRGVLISWLYANLGIGSEMKGISNKIREAGLFVDTYLPAIIAGEQIDLDLFDVKLIGLYFKFIPLLFMDAYTMARFFRVFGQDTPSNGIFYVGDTHASNYREIMNRLGFEPLYQSSSGEYTQCVRINDLPLNWLPAMLPIKKQGKDKNKND